MGNKPENKQKNENKQKGYTPPIQNKPRPFDEFSNPKKFLGGAPKSFNAFHRRLNTRRSSGGK